MDSRTFFGNMEDEVEVIEVVDLVSSESEAGAMEEGKDPDIDGDC